MLIRGAETSGPAVTQLANDGLAVWPATHDKAIFTHYGNQYFLHTVSVAGSATRSGVTKLERKS